MMARDLGRRSRKKGERWHARKREIADTAAHLFAKNGYAATGIADLCKATGLGKGALYYYIDSKEDLLVEIHDLVINPIIVTAEQIVASDKSPEEKLRSFTEVLVNSTATHVDHAWVYLNEWKALNGRRATAFRAKRAIVEKAVESVLRDGVKTGAFEVADIRLTVLAWFGMVNYMYQWYRPDGRLSNQDIAEGCHNVFTQGILASKRKRPASRNRN